MLKRFIAHIDLDCFFVSVERIHNKSLIDKPVVVGGSAEGRGVVASASYEARKFGVRSAMSTAKALKLCPGLIVIHGHHHEYSEYSNRIYQRMLEIAPVVERASIDEMYLDFTGCDSLLDNDIPGFMKQLQNIVLNEFDLPCTIGLSSNKLVSKIAANQVKPKGVIYVSHGTEAAYLAPLPVSVIPGVGVKTEDILKKKGFHFVSDIQKSDETFLKNILGKHGGWIYDAAHGRGSDILSAEHISKSIGREETLEKDISDTNQLLKILFELIHSVGATLRKYQWKTTNVSIKYRTSDFKTRSKQAKIKPTNYDPDIFLIASRLLKDLHDGKKLVRLIGISLSDFVEEVQSEPDLFVQEDKHNRIMKAVDDLRNKFGDGTIKIGE